MILRASSTCLLLLLCLLSATASFGQKIKKRQIKKIITGSVVNEDHFTGFALYDLDKNKMIFEQDAHKYFTPASNTKILTLYTCLNMLGDSIPGLRYIERSDSLIFWGTGDPALLHTTLKSIKVYELLKNSRKKLFYAAGNYSGNFYGRGWPYGDYDAYYQAEISALPLQNNVAILSADDQGELRISPSYLKIYLKQDPSFRPDEYTVSRDLNSNVFRYPAGKAPRGFKQEIPWKTSDELTLAMLADTLKRPLGMLKMTMPDSARTLYSASSDSVYRRLMLPSDNFIAEQLLLVCSSTLPGPLSTQQVIRYSKEKFMKDLPDEPQWADGSGLSRQNLFTPATMIALLRKLREKVGDEQRLFDMMPAGGLTGTLRTAYKTDNGKPFVWAKTGSLSNVHNQSGYLITRKGKRLIYSYMNNNYTRPTAEIRAEMVRVMTGIHNRY